VSTV